MFRVCYTKIKRHSKKLFIGILTLALILLSVDPSIKDLKLVTFASSSISITDVRDPRQNSKSQNTGKKSRYIQSNQQTNKFKNFPTIIGLGAKKCGTGALQNFLLQHSMIEKPHVDETHFFDAKSNFPERFWENIEDELDHKNLDSQLESLAVKYLNYFSGRQISDKSLIFEKTPRYLSTKEAPINFANFYRKLKNGEHSHLLYQMRFIIVLCNPVDRLWSEYNHIYKSNYSIYIKNWEETNNLFNFDDFSRKMISLNQQFLGRYINTTKFYHDKKLTTFDKSVLNSLHKPLRSISLKSIYLPQIKNWLTNIPEITLSKNFILVNGDELIRNPGKVLVKVQAQLGLPIQITKRNFKYNKEKGFFCLNNDGCLVDGKGTTRGKDGLKMNDETRILLEKIYRPYNKLLFEYLGINDPWF